MPLATCHLPPKTPIYEHEHLLCFVLVNFMRWIKAINLSINSPTFLTARTHAPKFTKSNTQAIDYPYPTANTPPLTTHHTLIVCEALRYVCPCDDDRDAKEDDCNSDVSTSDQFSRKQLRNAMILVLRRQKPSTNALDGLYLSCVDHMLEARCVEGCAVSLLRRTGVWQKSRWGLPFTHDGVGFRPTGRWRYIGCLYQGGAILNPLPLPLPLPLPSALRVTYNGTVYMLSEYDYICRVVNN